MKFKHYTNMYNRSKKSNRDIYTILDLNQLQSNKELLKKCAMLKEASLNGDLIAGGLYTKTKEKLNCVNVHNIGDILKGEFKTTNVLCYDIDNLTKEDTKRLFEYSKTMSQATMISPSRRGIKLFFNFKDNTITKQNLKLVYRKFGERIINRINTDLGTSISLDLSSNDFNRLCFIGTIVINEDMIDGVNDIKNYVTVEEFKEEREKYKKSNSFNNSSNSQISGDTLERVENSIQGLELRNAILIECYEDLMKYGFMFASLAKMDDAISENDAYTLFKRLVKLGDNDEDNVWVSKSGSGNRYNIAQRFKDYLDGWDDTEGNATIGSFFHICKTEYNITGLKIIFE